MNKNKGFINLGYTQLLPIVDISLIHQFYFYMIFLHVALAFTMNHLNCKRMNAFGKW